METRVDMIRCGRCGGELDSTHSRDYYKGLILHIFCAWKLRKDDKEREDANTLSNGGRDSSGFPTIGNKGSAGNPQGGQQG